MSPSARSSRSLRAGRRLPLVESRRSAHGSPSTKIRRWRGGRRNVLFRRRNNLIAAEGKPENSSDMSAEVLKIAAAMRLKKRRCSR